MGEGVRAPQPTLLRGPCSMNFESYAFINKRQSFSQIKQKYEIRIRSLVLSFCHAYTMRISHCMTRQIFCKMQSTLRWLSLVTKKTSRNCSFTVNKTKQNHAQDEGITFYTVKTFKMFQVANPPSPPLPPQHAYKTQNLL